MSGEQREFSDARQIALIPISTLTFFYLQIGAWVSDQSEPISSRDEMKSKAEEITVSMPPWPGLVHNFSIGKVLSELSDCAHSFIRVEFCTCVLMARGTGCLLRRVQNRACLSGVNLLLGDTYIFNDAGGLSTGPCIVVDYVEQKILRHVNG